MQVLDCLRCSIECQTGDDVWETYMQIEEGFGLREVVEYRAMYDFDGTGVDDGLPLAEGDVVTVIDQTDVGGWWEGTANARTGWFPASHVDSQQPSTTNGW